MAQGPSGKNRKQTDSLCAQLASSPRSFHFYSDTSCHVRHEVVDAMHATGKPQVAVAGLIGDVYGRLRAAQRGELRGSEFLEPVRDVPVLWELKWKIRKVGEFRLYHAEPAGNPDLVGLRFHRKDTSSNDRAVIDAAQDTEIATAAHRHDDGVNSRWGHQKRCADCVDP